MPVNRMNYKRAWQEQRQQLQRRVLWTVAVIVVLYLLTPAIVGDMSFLKYLKMRNTYHRLNEEIKHLSDENQAVQIRIKALRSDPKTIEQLARQHLGLVRPNEIVYQFHTDGS